MKNSFLIFLFSCLIAWAFFLPWGAISGGVAKIDSITGAKRAVATSGIKGYEIPKRLESGAIGMVVGFASIFNSKVTDMKFLAWLVYVVPLVGAWIALTVLGGRLSKKRLSNVFVVSVLFSAIFIFNIFYVLLKRKVLTIKPGLGMWLTLIGFSGIALFCFLDMGKKTVRRVLR